MSSNVAIQIENVIHAYGEHRALDGLSLSIPQGEIFALLGPNGSGKTTLFRLLSTLIPVQQGAIHIQDFDLSQSPEAVRRQIGVVFQAASLDRKLTVAENLMHQGHLYGLSGKSLRARCDAALKRLGVADRAKDLVETLSGGLRRRVELAKGLLHAPQVLLLDEPSTGLDPAARLQMWDYLQRLRDTDGVTIVLTTHMLEEADKADQLAILDCGQLVALGKPSQLRAEVGGDSISVETDQPEQLAEALSAEFACDAKVVDGHVLLHLAEGPRHLSRVAEVCGSRLQSLTLGRPTLEDVFIARTGHRFRTEESIAHVE